MHVDLNAFFASAEVVRNPKLKNKSLVVGGTRKRAIVSTASYEAREKGIRSGMPLFMAQKLDPNVIALPVDFPYYQRLSSEFFSYMHRYSSLVEIASIDECYVDMTETLKGVKDPLAYLKNIQDGLLKETGLPCSIGIGPTKFLAKMASDYKKPLGITIFRRRELHKTIWPMPIGKMYGIGAKTAPQLEAIGVKTIGDLLTFPEEELRPILGKFYFTAVEWAKGYGNDVVDDEPFDPKSVGASRTFSYDTDDYEQIEQMIRKLSNEIAKRAKKNNKEGATIQLVLRNSDFKTRSFSKTYPEPFSKAEEIFTKAMILFDKHYNNEPLRLVGVALQNVEDKKRTTQQLSLFDVHKEDENTSEAKQLVDDLNKEFKKDVFTVLSEYNEEK